MAAATTTSQTTRPPTGKAYCRLDDWEFDPRYTGGACPICGWRPEEAEGAAQDGTPSVLRRVPVDLIALAAVLVILLALGVVVGIAARIDLLPH
jgi:hypothetical protein